MDVIMPQLGETVTEGTVSVWHKKVGDRTNEGEPLFDASTDKAEMEIPTPASGVLLEILVPEGQTVAVGTRLAVIGDDTQARVAAPGEAAGTPETVPAVSGDACAAVRTEPAKERVEKRDARGIPLSPVVRRLIAEHGLAPGSIPGTGPKGRITRKDVLDEIARRTPGAAPAGDAARSVIPFGRLRKLTAEHMLRSKATSPHVFQAVEVDYQGVEQAREAVQEAWKARHGFSLTYLPFIAWALCRAVTAFPRINAHVEGDSLVAFKQINLGIAVDLNLEGLLVPVIGDSGDKSVPELARAIHLVSARARDRQLGPDEMSGGTYTISNSGSFGTLITAPIIHQPQVAILAVEGVRKKPVAVEGSGGDEIAVRPIGVLGQSFDHRAIDGAYSAAFLSKLREIIESHGWLEELERAEGR